MSLDYFHDLGSSLLPCYLALLSLCILSLSLFLSLLSLHSLSLSSPHTLSLTSRFLGRANALFTADSPWDIPAWLAYGGLRQRMSALIGRRLCHNLLADLIPGSVLGSPLHIKDLTQQNLPFGPPSPGSVCLLREEDLSCIF